MPLVKKYFTSNSSWTAPAGVTNVILIGCGGGGGGGSGGAAQSIGTYGVGGAGGGGSVLCTVHATVVPNTSYTVTIGAGGTGGTGATASNGNSGNAGSDTTFGALATFYGAGSGIGGYRDTAAPSAATYDNLGGGRNFRGSTGFVSQQSNNGASGITGHPYNFSNMVHGNGGMVPYLSTGGSNSASGYAGQPSLQGYAGGAGGGTSGSKNSGGGGGGGGPGGAGGAATAGSWSANTSNASSASANTGAGGGGSGGTGYNATNYSTGNGGDGGSGFLYVIWVD
jgi:hypothetical protein